MSVTASLGHLQKCLKTFPIPDFGHDQQTPWSNSSDRNVQFFHVPNTSPLFFRDIHLHTHPIQDFMPGCPHRPQIANTPLTSHLPAAMRQLSCRPAAVESLDITSDMLGCCPFDCRHDSITAIWAVLHQHRQGRAPCSDWWKSHHSPMHAI